MIYSTIISILGHIMLAAVIFTLSLTLYEHCRENSGWKNARRRHPSCAGHYRGRVTLTTPKQKHSFFSREYWTDDYDHIHFENIVEWKDNHWVYERDFKDDFFTAEVVYWKKQK